MEDGLAVARLLTLTHPDEDDDLLFLTPSDMGSLIEIENLVCLAGCTLDTHPGKSNWVEKNGGLPQYICEIAKDIVEGGKSISSAIAIAVGQVKKLAVKSTNPEVKAKAVKAVAQWEMLKSKAHAKNPKSAAPNAPGWKNVL